MLEHSEIKTNLKYTTVLLDFHGTFTSNRGRLAHSLVQAFRETTGHTITRAEFLGVLNRPEGLSVSDALRQSINGSMVPLQREHLISRYHDLTDEMYIPKHQYLIKKLAELGVTCAVVTNGQEDIVRETLDKWGLIVYMADIYGRGTGSRLEGIPKKPSVEVLEHVINDLRYRGYAVRRDRTLMVGDYQDDIEAGNKVGVATAFVVTGPNQEPEYYPVRPTYALLDTRNINPTSGWFKREGVYQMRDLPLIVKGEI